MREVEIEGSPDWLLEIVSDSSDQKKTNSIFAELTTKPTSAEYWIIDARGNSQIEFQILHWRRNGLHVAGPHKDGWQRARASSAAASQLSRSRAIARTQLAATSWR